MYYTSEGKVDMHERWCTELNTTDLILAFILTLSSHDAELAAHSALIHGRC